MAKIFGDAKPWQIAVIAIGALGAIGGVIYLATHNDAPPLKKTMTLVDVSTGDVFELDITKRPAILPELNPGTGKPTLLPAHKDTDGKWYVDSRYTESIEQDVPKTALVSASDSKFEVKLSGKSSPLK